MKIYALKGHERPLTCVKFNSDGDILFSCAKDGMVTAWYSENGERWGTYDGHGGAVNSLDVSFDSSLLVSGSSDNTARLWDVNSGENLFVWRHRVPIGSVRFSLGEQHMLMVTQPFMRDPGAIHIYQINRDDPTQQSQESQIVLRDFGSSSTRINEARWGPLNNQIFAACDDGVVRVIDVETGTSIGEIHEHEKEVRDLQFSKDQGCFITASSDMSARLFDTRTLQLMKTYTTAAPVNAAAISPLKMHVITGGGQEASMVTTTAGKAGRFEIRFFHTIFENELGNIPGHFGPVNALDFTRDGSMFASGGEEGYVRLHQFDDKYLKATDGM